MPRAKMVVSRALLLSSGSRRAFLLSRAGMACRNCSGSALQEKSPGPEAVEEIILLPRKKTWDKVAVLQALASTVNRDHTAAHYMFQDDPYLIPRTGTEFRLFSLSKESGKNAAKYIINTNPKYFLKDIAEPHIPCLMPENLALQLEEVSECALKERIQLRKVKASVDMYDQLLQAGTSISLETSNSLLDLLCFYGDKEPSQDSSHGDNREGEELEEIPEERKQRGNLRNFSNSSYKWRENNNAERIFNLMSEKNAHSYCTIIRGMVKHGAYTKSFDIYTDLLNNRFKADVYTFNALISAAGEVKEKYTEKWELIEDLLHQMAQQKVQPNLLTFNSVLKTLRRCGALGRGVSLQVLSEMKALNIEPSLATFDHILGIFYKSAISARGTTEMIYDVLDEIEGKSFYPQDPDDVLSSGLQHMLLSMEATQGRSSQLCSETNSILTKTDSHTMESDSAGSDSDSIWSEIHSYSNGHKCLDMKDVQLAYILHKVVETGENWKMMGNMNQRTSYCGRFFNLLCMMEQLDVVLKWYRELVPSMFYPSSQAMLDLLQALDTASHLEMIPWVWKDIKHFGHSHRAIVVEEVLALMARDAQVPETQVAFADCVADIKSVYEMQERNHSPLEWTATTLGNCTVLFARAGRTSEAWSMLDLFKKHNRVPSDSVMNEVLNCVIQSNSPDKALDLVKLATDFSLQSTSSLARRVLEEFQLSEAQRRTLDDMAAERSDGSDSD